MPCNKVFDLPKLDRNYSPELFRKHIVFYENKLLGIDLIKTSYDYVGRRIRTIWKLDDQFDDFMSYIKSYKKHEYFELQFDEDSKTFEKKPGPPPNMPFLRGIALSLPQRERCMMLIPKEIDCILAKEKKMREVLEFGLCKKDC